MHNSSRFVARSAGACALPYVACDASQFTGELEHCRVYTKVVWRARTLPTIAY